MSTPNTHPLTTATPLDEGSARTARQRRALAKRCAQVERWHAAIPAEQRRSFYLSEVIAAGTKLDPGHLGPALRALGWQHAQRRLPERAGLPVSVWAPPFAPNPRRPPYPQGHALPNLPGRHSGALDVIDPKLTTLSEIFADADDAAWNVARELAGPPQPTPHAQSGTNDDEVFEFLIDLDAVPAPGPAPRPMQPADDSRASDEAHTLEHRPIEPLAAPVFTTHDANPAAPLTEVQTEPAPPGPELTPLFPSARRSPAASAYMRKRAALHGDALDALALAVRRIREGLEDEGADFDDAIKAAPILHKHIEHFERLAAGQAQRDGAQMINARFGFDKRGEYFVSLELVQPDDFTDPLHAAE